MPKRLRTGRKGGLRAGALPPSPPSPPTLPNNDTDEGTEGQSNAVSSLRGHVPHEAQSTTPTSLRDVDETRDEDLDEDADPGTSSAGSPPRPDASEAHANYTGGGGGGHGYNALKSFHGQLYSGMAVGGSHTWNYDRGVWKETKEEPDLWKIDFQTTKRRARKAPEGSGAPVGTEYHWLIVAHQYVTKTDANTYETHMAGSKYKLAYKKAGSGSWSVPTVRAQREREVELLEDARRRVQGLPPVLATERARAGAATREKGQRTLDAMFGGSKAGAAEGDRADGAAAVDGGGDGGRRTGGGKRKRAVEDDGLGEVDEEG